MSEVPGLVPCRFAESTPECQKQFGRDRPLTLHTWLDTCARERCTSDRRAMAHIISELVVWERLVLSNARAVCYVCFEAGLSRMFSDSKS